MQQQQQQQPKVKLSKKDYLEKKEKEKELLNNNTSGGSNKSNREKDGKLMIEKNLIEKQNEILLNESKKQQSGQGIEKSFTLVPDSLGNLEKKNDLDQYWIKSKENYLSFITFLPNDNNELGTSEESILFMNSDLSQLLKFKYNIFWSHVIFNLSLNEFLDSFLRFFKRDSKPNIILVPSSGQTPTGSNTSIKGSKDFLESKKLLYRRVFLVLVRMSLQQERSGNFITRDYYADLIYKQKLFTIPKLFDIVSLFAPHSKQVTTDLVQRIFDVQPLYYKDLNNHIQLISKSLFELNQSLLNRNVLDLLRLEDNYLMDIVYNLEQFFRIFPMGSHVLIDECMNSIDNGNGNGGVLGWLVYFYEYMIPIFNRENGKSSNKQNLTASIYTPLKQHILSIFHTVFRHHFMIKVEQLQLLIQDPCQFCKRLSIEEISHRFLSLLGNITTFSQQIIGSTKSNRSRLFNEYFDSIAGASLLFDYEQTFRLSHFLDKLFNLDPTIDFTNYSYFMQLIGKPVSNDKQNQRPKKSKLQTTTTTTTSTSTSSEPKSILLNNPTILNTQKIDQVKVLFPDLGDWFVHCCLKFYNHNVEQVINGLCDESSLPSHLKSMDRTLNTDPSTTSTTSTTTTTTTTTSTNSGTSSPSFYNEQDKDNNDNDDVKSIESSLNQLNIGKKLDVKNDSTIAKARAFIKTSYELTYDDEYDDSLEEFSGFVVQDGEKYNNNDDVVENETINNNNNENNNNTENNNNNSNNRNNNEPHKPSSYKTYKGGKVLPSNNNQRKPQNKPHDNKKDDHRKPQPQQDNNSKPTPKPQQQDNNSKPAPKQQQQQQQPKPQQKQENKPAPKPQQHQENKSAPKQQQPKPQQQNNKPAPKPQQQQQQQQQPKSK